MDQQALQQILDALDGADRALPGYLSGAPVPGFYGFVEADFGDPTTPNPYPRVEAHHNGLSFTCPRCRGAQRFSDCAQRECYRDRRAGGQGNYWCPSCACRMFLTPCACAACPTAPSPTARPMAPRDRYLDSIDALAAPRRAPQARGAERADWERLWLGRAQVALGLISLGMIL